MLAVHQRSCLTADPNRQDNMFVRERQQEKDRERDTEIFKRIMTSVKKKIQIIITLWRDKTMAVHQSLGN